jgi:osmotically-inducible protein OsmY
MPRGNIALAAIFALSLASLLQGCVGAAVVGGLAAAGGVGYEAAQERGLDGTYNDIKLKSDISAAIGSQYGNVTATVYWGRVLLTGSSPSPEAKSQAEQVAGREPGVRAIYNEIEVATSEDAWESTQDSWITTRVRSDMVLDTDVRSGNYVIETDRKSVYLLGSARSQAELDRATQIARYVPGVQRVVSYVEIRYGVANGGQPQPQSYQSGPPPGAMGPSGPPPSNAPIQVQKL